MSTDTLAAFIALRRGEIVRRCREKMATRRSDPPPNDREFQRGVPLFLDELVIELTGVVSRPREMQHSATTHGADLFFEGFNVAQVVQTYGGVCQAITDLAVESNASISVEDFRTLNKCLDNAIANAVSEHARQQQNVASDQSMHRELNLRNLIDTAVTGFEVLQSGAVGIGGTTGELVHRSLAEMRKVLWPPSPRP